MYSSEHILTALAMCVSAVTLGCGGSVHASPPAQPSSAAQPGAGFFSPVSFWNVRLAVDAPVDPGSAGMVSELGGIVSAELRAKNGPWINASHDGVTIVTVPAAQATVAVRLDHAPDDAALAAAWSAVPLPAAAQPSSGDHDLAVWQPSTDRMWEFFGLTRQPDGWHAEWGGAMRNVSSNRGVYGPDAWPGAKDWWGVTAASLPIVGGAMTNNELAAGQINHALALVVPNVRQGAFASPAKRQDGTSTSPNSLPEGARLRLDPKLNLDSLQLPPLTRIIAQAAQRYGIIIRDHSPIIAFIAQDPTTPPSNILQNLYHNQYPWQLMAAFPWNHLQVLNMNLHTRP